MSMICFHDPKKENGYLSNWYPCNFTFGGVNFSSSEQYMMYSKAMLFGDNKIAQQILETYDVAKQQLLGRQISKYMDSMWNGMRQIIMYEGLIEKFSQNPDLRDKLLDTGNDILVECAKTDLVWACGLSIYDDDRFNIKKWKGQNLLGYVLMLVRNVLK